MADIASTNNRARVIAFYLPQFHPIPENDEWWSKGFTEWTNACKAKPLYRGHIQPHLPSELGFYDLRVPETRIAQADLAREHGIEGFCYWHYWFAGKRLLERPFSEVMTTGEPDFPFCLGWANHTWTGVWHGSPNRVLIEQTYPGPDDYRAHFDSLLPAFTDLRHIRVDGKPIFVVFRPDLLPEPQEFIELWRILAQQAGLKGLFFVGHQRGIDLPPEQIGFDASISGQAYDTKLKPGYIWTMLDKLANRSVRRLGDAAGLKPRVYSYKSIVKRAFLMEPDWPTRYPVVVPNWDNTPRCGNRGYVFHKSTPELFRQYLRKAILRVENRDPEHKLIFLKSWNEWAEGNYMEPDIQFGRAYLEVLREEVSVGGNVPSRLTEHSSAKVL